MLKDKTLCDFTKSDFEKYKDLLKEITKEPKYICKKCYRASSDKDFLCKPTKL